MKSANKLFTLLFFSLCFTTVSNAQQFWLDPSIAHHLGGTYEQGSTEGEVDSGYGINFRVFGFVSRAFYLGLSARYDQIDITYDPPVLTGGSTLTDGESSYLTGGPMIGVFGLRYRAWLIYHPKIILTEEFKDNGTQSKFEKTGWGGTAGIGFWAFRWLSINFEYNYHVYDEAENKITGVSGPLGSDLKLSSYMLSLSFPISL